MKHRKTLCILGGTGFVGHHLLPQLIKRGYQLKVLTRNRASHRDLLVLPTLKLIECNIHDEETLSRQFADCDGVINLVGILNEFRRRRQTFTRVYVELPRKVVAACRNAGVGRLLHMSSLGADAGKGPSRYLRTRGEGERIVLEAGADLCVTVFKPSVIFGPGDSFLVRFAGLLKLAPGIFPLACPGSRFAPVFVDDVAAAFVTSLDEASTFGKSFELCGPRVYTLRELIDYVARFTGRRRVIVNLPDWAARLQAAVLQFAPGKPFTPDNYRSLSQDNICTENGLKELGIRATAIEAKAPGFLSGFSKHTRLNEFRKVQEGLPPHR